VPLLVLPVPIRSVSFLSSNANNSVRCLAPLNRFSCLQVPYDNCKVHSPLDCALLGITETTAQVYLFTHKISEPSITNLSFFCFLIFKLDYGTYKIINRACALTKRENESMFPRRVIFVLENWWVCPAYLHWIKCNSFASGKWVREMTTVCIQSKISA
jgi:hypothetical protein